MAFNKLRSFIVYGSSMLRELYSIWLFYALLLFKWLRISYCDINGDVPIYITCKHLTIFTIGDAITNI
jgi:hypothetical protein